MADRNSLILSVLRNCQGNTLLVADENCLDFPFASAPGTVRVISNRFDVAEQAEHAGLTTLFSDYNFDNRESCDWDNIIYPVSKEKPVVHYIANNACQLLREQGKLWLVGGKQQGIKTFAKTVGRLFGCQPLTSKEGQLYIAEIHKHSCSSTPLDDRDYPQLREIGTTSGVPILSKPGLFGWDKIDVGSELLAGHLDNFLTPFAQPEMSLLDLGCGYGYLSLMANKLRKINFTATDNCAAAIVACRENFSMHNIAGDVVADDCGAHINKEFDAILCNPPFHQGFQQERKLTEKFLYNTRRLMKRDGRALFVVNQFVPLESLAQPFFKKIDLPITAKGFKLVELAG